MTPYITLNLTERRLAEFIAKCRYETSRKRGFKNLKVSNEKVEITELEGIASELAFCKYMNVYPDLEIKVSDWDCVLPNGEKVDIKTTMYSTGKLLAHLNKKGKKIDVFVLALGKFPTYRFAGYALTADLIRDERITDLGYGPTYAMMQADLRDIKELR